MAYKCYSTTILVGSMVDKESDREVSYSEAKDFASKRGMDYIEVSSKTGHNMQNLLEMIATVANAKRLFLH